MLSPILALALAAGPGNGDARFEAFAQKYIQELIDRDPETATRLGEHRNDARLNDYSAAGARKDLTAARSALSELSRIELSTLSSEDAVDARTLKNRLDSQIYELATIRGWEWNPLQYNVGGAIHALISREFAPPEQRWRATRNGWRRTCCRAPPATSGWATRSSARSCDSRSIPTSRKKRSSGVPRQI